MTSAGLLLDLEMTTSLADGKARAAKKRVAKGATEW
jgi:hypothetical protein